MPWWWGPRTAPIIVFSFLLLDLLATRPQSLVTEGRGRLRLRTNRINALTTDHIPTPQSIIMKTPTRRQGSALLLLAVAYAAYLFRGWIWEENFIRNVLNVFTPLWSVDPIRGRDVDVQVSFLSKVTRNMEILLGKAPRFLMHFAAGPDIAAASFGPTATKVVRLDGVANVPPMVCACPRSADSDDILPLVLYFHSGGMVVGSVDAELHYARYIAHEASAVVCSVEYRKAPAYQLSDVLEDVVAASLSLLGHTDGSKGTPTNFGADLIQSLGIGAIDRSRAATFGISAGGYLAGMVLRLLAVREGWDDTTPIRVQISIVPMVRPHAGTASMVEYFHNAPDWSGDYNTYAWSALLPDDRDGTQTCDWQTNLMVEPPVTMDKKDEQNMYALPPAYVVTATKDILRDEGRMYAEHLRGAGRLIEHVEYNTNHGGVFPELSRRGPGDQAFFRAVQVLSSRLNDD